MTRPSSAIVVCDRCDGTRATVRDWCSVCGPVPLCDDCNVQHTFEALAEHDDGSDLSGSAGGCTPTGPEQNGRGGV